MAQLADLAVDSKVAVFRGEVRPLAKSSFAAAFAANCLPHALVAQLAACVQELGLPPPAVGDGEPWHCKVRSFPCTLFSSSAHSPLQDVAALLCQLLLFTPLETQQATLLAVVMDAVLAFGTDGLAVVALCLALRLHYDVGRAAEAPAESQWLAGAVPTAMRHAISFLLSDKIGDVRLAGLVRSLE